jgi:trigger factor
MAPEDDVLVDTDQEQEEQKKLSLEIKIDKPSACKRHITVVVPREDVDRYLDEAYSELMPSASVPGFRAGRAPRKLVENRFKDEVGDKVKSSILMDAMSQATEDEDLSAISEPDFDYEAVELPKEGPMTFEFELEVRPDFDLPEWKGLEIEKPTREFKKEDVDEQLKKVLGRFSAVEESDAPVAAGDMVTVNATFSADGKEVSKLEDQLVFIKADLSFPDSELKGFGDLMAGAKIGDTKTAKLTIGADAPNEELRGKEVEASIEVLKVERMVTPELTEEMLGEIGGFDTEGDLRDAVQGELERQLNYHQQQRVRQQIRELLTKTADFDLPADLLARQSERELERAVLELRSAGFDEGQIQAYENDLRRNSQQSTEASLTEHFILERIAEEEDIDAKPEDYDMEIAMIAAQQGQNPRRVRASLEKRGMMDSLRNQIVERQVVELITGSAKFKEIDFTMGDDQTEAIDHYVAGGETSNIPEAKHGGDAQELREEADYT